MDKFKNIGESCFIKTTDLKSNTCVFPISDVWWSRLYEYPWAMQFAEANDICLDAACGTVHHLKFYLAQACRTVYCCDLDPMMNTPNLIFESLMPTLSEDTYNNLLENASKMDFKCCNLSSLPYEDKFFNKVYCISVLEHLDTNTLKNSLMEFYRVLKDDGFIVLTFDYPSINLELLSTVIDECNLKFAYDVDFTIPQDCLDSHIYPGLKCFKALLVKKVIV